MGLEMDGQLQSTLLTLLCLFPGWLPSTLPGARPIPRGLAGCHLGDSQGRCHHPELCRCQGGCPAHEKGAQQLSSQPSKPYH